MPKNSNKNVAPAVESVFGDLQKLAHAGTKEAIEKIEKFLKAEKDPEKKAYAEMALEECEMFYYNPANEKEEQEFLLCELIRGRERRIDDLAMKAEKIKADLEESSLEGKVHEKVLVKHQNKKEEWKYNWMHDFVAMEENELPKIEDDIAYNEAWIMEAKKMITTARYKNMPDRYLEHFDSGFEKGSLGDDDDSCDCCDR